MATGDFPATALETRADWGYTTKDNLSNTIKAATTFNIGATSLTLTSSTAFPAQGWLLIDSEVCLYTANNTGTGVLTVPAASRALQGTAEANHSAGTTVYLCDSGGVINRMAAALEAALAKIGINGSAVTTTIDYLLKTSNAANQEAWTVPTLLNSWVSYNNNTNSNVGYMKDTSGFVHLKGTVKDGTVGQPIFTLASGYRPARDCNFPVTANAAHGNLVIYSTGNVSLSAGSNVWLTLDGVTFQNGQI